MIIGKSGRLNTVSNRMVKPAVLRQTEEQSQQERRDKEEPSQEERKSEEGLSQEERRKKEFDKSEIKTKVRPKRGARIQFQLDQEEGDFEGRVTNVGKPTGKDKNRCWIKGEDKEERSFNFSKEVKGCRNIHNVNFVQDVPKKDRI